MVSDLIRDSPFGHVVRLVTGRKYFQYPEEKDHELWKKYVNEEKSGYMAHHGTAEPPKEESDDINQAQGLRAREDSESSSRTLGEGHNEASGVRVDPEKGKDKHVVDWYGPDDPQVSLSRSSRTLQIANSCVQNPRNWSRAKKFFVTFEICFLTFSVYIGSAIYTPGIIDVTEVFGVAQVPATLGLTLYVAGYGLGPVLWSPMSEIPQIGRLWVYMGTLCMATHTDPSHNH
jgi:DHA1 family multidrug resistance protein-like MFS transporter